MIGDVLLEYYGVLYDFTKDIYETEDSLMFEDSIIEMLQYPEDAGVSFV